MRAVTSRVDTVQGACPLNAPWNERSEKHRTQFAAVNLRASLLSLFVILKEDSPRLIKNAKPLVLITGNGLKLPIKSGQMHGIQARASMQIQ
jgi:hypothetical protein